MKVEDLGADDKDDTMDTGILGASDPMDVDEEDEADTADNLIEADACEGQEKGRKTSRRIPWIGKFGSCRYVTRKYLKLYGDNDEGTGRF